MEDNKYRKQDELAKAFREKLANHSLPVDEAVWSGIQAKLAAGTGMEPAPVSRKLLAWWVPVSAVASLALLLTVGWYLFTDSSHQEMVKLDEKVETGISSDPFLPVEMDNKQVKPLLAESQKAKIQQHLQSDNELLSAVSHHNTVADSVLTNESIQVVNDDSGSFTEVANRKTNIDKKEKKDLLAPVGDWTRLIAEPEPRKPLLAAGISSGVGGTNPAVNGMDNDAMYVSFVDYTDRPLRAPAALSPADFKSRDYLPPLTIGVKLRIPLDDTWSLESGLQYTYLKTNLSDANWSGYSADLQLHYLGVPVAMSATLSRSANWELYWSGGVLLEKGLNSLYHEYRDWGNAVFTTTASKGIEGQQWSLFTTLGVGYRIDKNLMLYFDPQLSYFFDNQQPLSIRTEMPLMVGVNAGLRFTF
jgi:hypothetical protein